MVDKHALIMRVSKLVDDEISIKSGDMNDVTPEKVTFYLKDIVGNLYQESPDMIRLAASARAVIWWCFDQGFETITKHKELERVVIDLAKFGTVSEVLEKAKALEAPKLVNFAKIINTLENLLTKFGPDGSLDRSEYERLSIELNALVEEDRAAYVRFFGHSIEAI